MEIIISRTCEERERKRDWCVLCICGFFLVNGLLIACLRPSSRDPTQSSLASSSRLHTTFLSWHKTGWLNYLRRRSLDAEVMSYGLAGVNGSAGKISIITIIKTDNYFTHANTRECCTHGWCVLQAQTSMKAFIHYSHSVVFSLSSPQEGACSWNEPRTKGQKITRIRVQVDPHYVLHYVALQRQSAKDGRIFFFNGANQFGQVKSCDLMLAWLKTRTENIFPSCFQSSWERNVNPLFRQSHYQSLFGGSVHLHYGHVTWFC